MDQLNATGIPMDERIIDEAIAWHVAQGAAGDAVSAADAMDWDAFTLWLEADPRHSMAYEEIAALDAAVLAHRIRLMAELPANDLGEAAEDVTPNRSRWRGAVAVVALVCLTAFLFLMPDLWQSESSLYQTKAGETRQIALQDGTRIVLAPLSTLMVRNAAQDQMELAGSAYFDVPHRPDRVMSITAGGFSVQDIGTRFEIATSASETMVAVAEGRVGVRAGHSSSAVNVQAGKRLIGNGARATMDVSDYAAQDVAGWRGGRLVYQNTPISLVAADLARYTNQQVIVDKSIEGRRFSGVLVIGDGSKLVRNVQHLMGIKAQADGRALRLVARGIR